MVTIGHFAELLHPCPRSDVAQGPFWRATCSDADIGLQKRTAHNEGLCLSPAVIPLPVLHLRYTWHLVALAGELPVDFPCVLCMEACNGVF